MANLPKSSVLRFGAFEIDSAIRELRKGGVRIKLQPQPFKVLVLLTLRSGHVVTRDEIQREIWGTETYVDFDQGLNFCIRKIRAALNDDADKPRYIQTIAGTGYRFIVPVSGPEHGFIESTPPNLTSPQDPAPAYLQRPRVVVFRLAISLALFVVGLILTFRWIIPSATHAPLVASGKPFTAYIGREMYPAFSPDGNQIAFSWNGQSQDNYDIYVKLIGDNGPLRLTTHRASDLYPVWSPDGRYIAFCRLESNPKDIPPGHLNSLMTVYTVPALGGAERKITECLGNRNLLPSKYLDWSPDGKFLVIVDKDREEEPFGLFLISLETGERKRLTMAPRNSIGDTAPAFSPDGRTVAFTRIPVVGAYQIYFISTTGGEPKRLLVEGFSQMREPCWMPDGQAIVFYGERHGDSRLWRVSVKGGEPDALPISGEYSVHATISRRGNRLAYQSTSENASIWRVDATMRNPHLTSSVKLIGSTRLETSPKYSPDGKSIAFVSNRSGAYQIWVTDSNGQDPVQVTHFENLSRVGGPSWSPDGTRIAFECRIDENYDIYVIRVEGGTPLRLTREPSLDVNPSWSRDGDWIYFCSDRSGTKQIWKLPPSGGEAIQVTRNGGSEARESPDGKTLYYSKDPSIGGLWSVPARGGEEVLVYEPLRSRYWDVVNDGLYFVEEINKKHFIQFLSFATGRRSSIFQIGTPWMSQPGLSVSPDRHWVLYQQIDGSNSDIMLVENFR